MLQHEGTDDSDARLGAWLRDSLHSADKLARNQVLRQLVLCVHLLLSSVRALVSPAD